MRKLIGLLMLVCAGWAGSMNAATLVVSGGKLTGATGVDVSGALYDVEFLFGPCAGLFSGCDAANDFQFSVSTDAQSAASALLSQVFIGSYENFPGSTYGCWNAYYSGCSAIIPYLSEDASGSFTGATAINMRLGYLDTISSVTWSRDQPTFGGNTIFAKFSPSPVPLPAAAWLFISAIAGLAGAKRLSRSKGSA